MPLPNTVSVVVVDNVAYLREGNTIYPDKAAAERRLASLRADIADRQAKADAMAALLTDLV